MLRAALLVPLLVVGLVSFLFVRNHADDGDTLVARQQHAQTLTPSAVAATVRAAPDPVTKAHGIAAKCSPHGSGALRNPWDCAIRYGSGRYIRYQVTIGPSGSYMGDHMIVQYQGQTLREGGEITGCCVPVG